MSTTTDQTQRMIFLALPFVFVLFVINFPAGLLVYWITTNLWTIVQQAIIRKRLGPLRRRQEEARGLFELLAAAPRGRRPAGDAGAAAGAERGEGAGKRRRQRAQGPAVRAAAGAARARRRSARDAGDERRPAIACGTCSSTSSEALGARGLAWSSRTRTGHPRDARGRRPRAVHRPPRPDDRRRPAPRVQDRDRDHPPSAGRARGRRRRRLPRAPRAGAAPPGRRGGARRRRAPAGRWRSTR